MNRFNIIKSQLLRKFVKSHVNCRNAQVSVLCSADDEIYKPNDFLMNLSLKAIEYARKVDLKNITKRIKNPPFFIDIFPGEHYKLLAGFILALKPKTVVEIGTAQGLSALCMKKYLPKSSKLITFDIVDWANFKDSYLKVDDFDKNFVQYNDDLSDYFYLLKYKNIFKSADMIFIDAGKDGIMEYKFMENFKKMKIKQNAIIIFDDIRLWNMLNFWRNLEYPKLDLTSFGHWTGTGVVQWRNK